MTRINVISCMLYFEKYREANGYSPDINKITSRNNSPFEVHIKHGVICESCTNADFVSSPWYYCSNVKGDRFFCGLILVRCDFYFLHALFISTYIISTYCHERVCFNFGEFDCYVFKCFLFNVYISLSTVDPFFLTLKIIFRYLFR